MIFPKNFRANLCSHLLGRVLDRDEDESFTPAEMAGLKIRHDKIYWHQVIRVNYTTYDLRRKQDPCNSGTRPDVMLLAESDSSHPYGYARIVRFFHVKAAYNGPGPVRQEFKRMNVAWVRWFLYDLSRPFSFKRKRLPQVRFEHYTRPDSFGFIDPDLIIRATHLIPRFAQGLTSQYLPPSIARPKSEKDTDYRFYFVNM